MLTGWWYRLVSVAGVVALTAGAVFFANHPIPQELFTTYVPVFNRLDPQVMTGESLGWAYVLTVVAVAGSLIPLYKPRPRRVLDSVFLAQKRVITGGLALATLGFFKWSHRLPRATLVMIVGILLVTIPAWFVWIRRPPASGPGRTLIVGDDPDQIERVAHEVSEPVLGYLCPTNGLSIERDPSEPVAVVTDGGVAIERLGGLSRIEDVLVAYDVDTAILAFRHADRAEFFGALDACYEHGVAAKVHREYADNVLVADDAVGPLVDVELEPWDPQDYLFKRAFDVAFASIGLLVLSPVILAIAVAIKLDNPGPVLYRQKRTADLGEPFTVYKFRTMIPEGESPEPIDDEENDRITRVGRVLRKTHFDEIPQLWSILTGRMSAVGPRAAWTEEEALLEERAEMWRKRWFVKPGLTGLAQINDAKSTDPEVKLRYDLEYIRRQSFWLDVKIVVRQVWKVILDVRAVRRANGEEDGTASNREQVNARGSSKRN